MQEKIKKILQNEFVLAIAKLPTENLIVLYETIDGFLYNTIMEGSKDEVSTPPFTEIITMAKMLKSKNIVIVHNHPPLNGKIETRPSQGDVDSTLLLRNILREYDISIFDHIIVTREGYFSFKIAGIL